MSLCADLLIAYDDYFIFHIWAQVKLWPLNVNIVFVYVISNADYQAISSI